MHVHFFTIQSGRVTQVFLTYVWKPALAAFWSKNLNCCVMVVIELYESWKKEKDAGMPLSNH